MDHINAADILNALDADAVIDEILGLPQRGITPTKRWEYTDALAVLGALKKARIALDEKLRERELHAAEEAFELGARWVDIADAAGVARQTAQATYRDRRNRPRRRRSSTRDDASWPPHETHTNTHQLDHD